MSGVVTPLSSTARQGWSLFLLAFAHLILAIDFTIVYIALPDIGRELGFSNHSLQWVIHGYTVAFGGFLLIGGRASDLLGRRRVFVAGLAMFGLASLLGGFASAPATLVAARALQGIGAAFIFPSTLALINALFAEGQPRVKALAVWSLFGSSGLALGSLLGGILVGLFGWKSVFLVNVPLGLLTAGGALMAMPRDRAGHEVRRFDLAGAITVTVASILSVVALVEGPVSGWTSASVMSSVGMAAIALVAFVNIEQRTASPLMPMRLLHSRNLQIAMALTAIFMGTFMALPYFETMLFQRSYSFTPLQTGLAFLVPCLAQAAGTQLGARIMNRHGMRGTIMLGLGMGAAGTAMLATGMSPGLGYAALLPGLIVGCLGQGMSWGPIWVAVGTGVAEHEQGVASAMASTTFQVGGAIGLALLVGIADLAQRDASSLDGADAIRATAQIATYCAAGGILMACALALLLRNPAATTKLAIAEAETQRV